MTITQEPTEAAQPPHAGLTAARGIPLGQVSATAVSAIVGRVLRKHLDDNELDAAKFSSVI